MKCSQLLTLLPTEDYEERWENETYQTLAKHIRTCELCNQGITKLSVAVIAEDMLSCDTCRSRLPMYYEARHSPFIPSSASDVDIVEVAIHLGQCANCAEEYHVLVELWDMEEQL